MQTTPYFHNLITEHIFLSPKLVVRNRTFEFLLKDKLVSDLRRIVVCVFMFIGKNFSGLGHLKTVSFQIFHVQGCCFFFFFG